MANIVERTTRVWFLPCSQFVVLTTLLLLANVVPQALAQGASVEPTPAGAAPAGSTVTVKWSGPNRPGDYITVVPEGARPSEYLNYRQTSDGRAPVNPVSLVMPAAPGAYEIRYMGGNPREVLAAVPYEVTAVTASIDGPASVTPHSRFEVAWSGPNNGGDWVTIVAAGAIPRAYGSYVDARSGTPDKKTGRSVATLRAPAQPGRYELRYVQQGTQVIVTRAIEVATTPSTGLSSPAQSTVTPPAPGPGVAISQAPPPGATSTLTPAAATEVLSGTPPSTPAPAPPTTTVSPVIVPGVLGSTVGGAGSSGSPPAPVSAGCDADIVSLACVLSPVRNGSTVTQVGNFHSAADVTDWFVVTASMSANDAPFAVVDFSLAGGAADGSYAIDVSEGSPGASTLVGASGAARLPQTTVSWPTASQASKTLFIQVRHVAGAPANDLYTLRVSMSGAQTAPPTSSSLTAGVMIASIPSAVSRQTDSVLQKPQDTPPPAGTTSTTITPDQWPNACSSASPLNVATGQSMVVNGTIETADTADWFLVRVSNAATVVVTVRNVTTTTDGTDFQIATFANCGNQLSTTTGAGAKTIDVSGSGPREILVRVSAGPWNAAHPMYTLSIVGR